MRAVIPTMILQAFTGSETLSLGSLHPTRDFNFVLDTVAGLIAILDSKKSIGETINIGSGTEISIGDTVKLVSELTGKKLEVKTDQTRLRPENSEVERLCCDNSKIQKLLGWKPAYTLKKGLTHTIEWFSDTSNRAYYHDVCAYVV